MRRSICIARIVPSENKMGSFHAVHHRGGISKEPPPLPDSTIFTCLARILYSILLMLKCSSKSFGGFQGLAMPFLHHKMRHCNRNDTKDHSCSDETFLLHQVFHVNLCLRRLCRTVGCLKFEYSDSQLADQQRRI